MVLLMSIVVQLVSLGKRDQPKRTRCRRQQDEIVSGKHTSHKYATADFIPLPSQSSHA